jgi:hypothetical protein
MWGTCDPSRGVNGAVGDVGGFLACDAGFEVGDSCKEDEGVVVLATVSVITVVVLVQVLVLESETIDSVVQSLISKDWQEYEHNTCAPFGESEHEWEW